MSVLLKIKVNRSEVLHEVGRLTGYIGKKRDKEDGTYDRIATIKPDDALLSQFFIEGSNTVTSELKPFHASFSSEENNEIGEIVKGYFAECPMSDNWDSSLIEHINSSVFRFLVNYITYRWLMQVMDFNEAVVYDKIAKESLNNIITSLYETTRPSHGYNKPLPN